MYKRQVQALTDVSLKVKSGEKVALLGSNGAGKSSLIDIFSGQKWPSSGTLQIFEGQYQGLQQRQQFSVLPQTMDFPKELKVKDVLRVVDSHYDCSKTSSYVERLDIATLTEKHMDQLSGGEKRRVAFLLTFIGSPNLLILDEPTANIDIETRRLMYAFIEDYFAEPHRTLLFSSHQISEVQRLADRIVVLHKGKVVLDETLKNIQSSLASKKISFDTGDAFDVSTLKDIGLAQRSQWVAGKAEIFSEDSDAFVAGLVESKIPFANLRIEEANLEEFVLKLWGQL